MGKIFLVMLLVVAAGVMVNHFIVANAQNGETNRYLMKAKPLNEYENEHLDVHVDVDEGYKVEDSDVSRAASSDSTIKIAPSSDTFSSFKEEKKSAIKRPIFKTPSKKSKVKKH